MLELLLDGGSPVPFKNIELKTTLTTPASSICAGVWNGKIVMVGGQTNSTSYSTNVNIYDPTTNTISLLFNRTTAVATTHPVVIGNDLYIFGGRNTADLGTGWKINLVSKTETQLPSLPLNSANIRTIVLNNRYIYIVPGSRTPFLVYDTVNNTLTNISERTINPNGGFLFEHESEIYYYGGWYNGAPSTSIHKYSFTTNTWSVWFTFDSSKFQSVFHGGYCKNGILSFIGYNGTSIKALRFDMKKKIFSSSFDTGLTYRNQTSVVNINDDLYLIGGSNIGEGNTNHGASNTLFNTIHKLN